MSKNAGQLLWNRQRINLPAGTTQVNTGLTQINRSFESESIGEPPLGVTAAPPGPAPGTLPASRVQVIPLAQTDKWANVTHGEPYLNPATNTIFVAFQNASEIGITDLNVLFWLPHSMIGPGDADTYNLAD
jgi:hypothetical protein